MAFGDQMRALGPGVLTIGSGTEATWRILNVDLEPLHAIVTLQRDGRALIVRGTPRAMIEVNGEELPEGKGLVAYGDTIRLASATFTYRQSAHEVAPTERYLRDTRRGRSHRLAKSTEIGRDPRCTIVVQEPEVSRIHAEVQRHSTKYVARPVGTAYVLLNGTHLTGEAELRDGDELVVGRTTLVFSAEPGPYQVSEPAAEPRPAPRSRASKMQTVYMGAIEVREREERGQRRRITLFALAALGLTAVLWFLLMG